MLTTRHPVLLSDSNHFSRSWLFGAVAPWIFYFYIWSGQKPWWNWYLTPVVNFGGPEGPVSQIRSPHLLDGAPGIFSDLLRSVQMLRSEWGAESNGKLPHLLIPSKTAPWFLSLRWKTCLRKNCSLGTYARTVNDLPLGRTLWWWWWWCLSRLTFCFMLRETLLIWTFSVVWSTDCKSTSGHLIGLTGKSQFEKWPRETREYFGWSVNHGPRI